VDEQDIRDTGKALIEGVTKAWDRLTHQVDEILGWSPSGAPAPGQRSPSAMTDGELRAALRAIASGLIRDIDPALQASFPAEDDPRWRFNLPATAPAHLHHMFTEASDAFGLAVAGLDRHASSADLALVGRLAEILARARWLLEPSDAEQRRERGYALTGETLAQLRSASDRAGDAGSAGGAGGADGADQTSLAGQIAGRTATMQARLAELRQDDGLRAVPVPKRRKLLRAYLPGDDTELFAVLQATGPRGAVAPPALFYREPSAGDALYAFERSHLTRAYWLARATGLYAALCAAAGPVLGRGDWTETVALAQARLRPLAEETTRRYRQRLQRGLHPGL
jgi:hypothetical protein